MSDQSLKRSVTTMEALSIVVGMIIGSGIFLKPGVVLASAGSPLGSILAWVAGGVITLASALSVAEIASVIPKTGGLYVYLEELYGEQWGFLFGWVQTIISCPASIAAQTIAFATYAGYFIPLTDMGRQVVAISSLAFVLIMNTIATKCGGVIQTLATIGKLVPVVAIIGFGLFSGSAPGSEGVPQLISGSGFGAAILGTLWAYDGWVSVTNMAGELKDPKRQLPRVISLGVVFVILTYVAFNLAIFRTLPYHQIVGSATSGTDAAIALFGSAGAAFITAGIMVSVFGSLNGYVMTGSRVPLAMSRRGQLPFAKTLGKVHPKLRTPANALLLESAIAVLYILSGSFETLTDLIIFVLWIFFTMGVVGVFILRKKFPKSKDTYKVPLFPFTPIVGIIGGGYILGSTLLSQPVQSFVGIGITLIGLPVFYYLNGRKGRKSR